ncbi:T9SS type A sorting domain-containing protein [Tenacibaculum dicentrarchi]|nr:T9SS type A sorting domain-containing protein [Tenacibaculum dicentrarchi]
MKKLLFLTLLIGYYAIGNTQNINFPDSNFKNALLNHSPLVDTDSNGEISVQEAENSKYLRLTNKGISDLSGIENFSNLEGLTVNKNQLISIDLTKNTKLKLINLSDNKISNINITNNLDLKSFSIRNNKLTDINIATNLNLTSLDVFNNNIQSIDISKNVLLTNLNVASNFSLGQLNITKNVLLKHLYAFNNGLTEIDISNNTNLVTLNVMQNNLLNLDVSKNVLLTSISVNNNKLTDINLSNNSKLGWLRIQYNKLNTLNVRPCSLIFLNFEGNSNLTSVSMTGQSIGYTTSISGEEKLNVNLKNCPKLEFICAEQEYLNDIFTLLEEANQTSCMLSNDCDVPHNRIKGTVTYDVNGDGCDSADVPFTAGLRVSAISLTNGQSTVAYPNQEGKYALHISDDTYFIAPALQNLNYFTFSTPVTPTPINIPVQLNTLITDYCVKSVGNFNDLEVSIVPLTRARPGFNATYKLTYKNIGTTTQSGTVTLNYQENVLNYVSSIPTVNSDTNGQLTWSFTNLLPLKSVEIPVTFVLNTPLDSPALNNGDILNYKATVTGKTDQTPNNNVMTLSQTVVNSYDPNDKTCLEGNILNPDNVGQYLHYLIRFENKGTAEAVNIRVKDVIDTTKLDIESLIPLKSSHSYSTIITNGNEVEFIFKNINLPFDDANNDGYVLFKIKSKETLVEGDKIVNGAAIYFDFNAPVITENEIVTVKKEVIEQPEFSNYFTLSPNPTTGILNLKVLNDNIQISYITIYDIGGNLVGYYFGNTRVMNVSYLYPNNYFMKIITNKGELVTKFIKL